MLTTFSLMVNQERVLFLFHDEQFYVVRNTEYCEISFWVVTRRLCTLRAGFSNRLCKLKPRASRSKGASSKLWYA